MNDKDGVAYPLAINNMIEVNSSLGLLEAARCHQGIVCLPTYMLGNYIDNGELLPVLLDYNPKTTPFALYALYSRRTPMPRKSAPLLISWRISCRLTRRGTAGCIRTEQGVPGINIIGFSHVMAAPVIGLRGDTL